MPGMALEPEGRQKPDKVNLHTESLNKRRLPVMLEMWACVWSSVSFNALFKKLAQIFLILSSLYTLTACGGGSGGGDSGNTTKYLSLAERKAYIEQVASKNSCTTEQDVPYSIVKDAAGDYVLHLNVSDPNAPEQGIFEEVVECDSGARRIGFDLDQNETTYQREINNVSFTSKPRIEQYSQVGCCGS